VAARPRDLPVEPIAGAAHPIVMAALRHRTSQALTVALLLALLAGIALATYAVAHAPALAVLVLAMAEVFGLLYSDTLDGPRTANLTGATFGVIFVAGFGLVFLGAPPYAVVGLVSVATLLGVVALSRALAAAAGSAKAP
jgi:hypothetical protein